jgi:hypothetical protein
MHAFDSKGKSPLEEEKHGATKSQWLVAMFILPVFPPRIKEIMTDIKEANTITGKMALGVF